MPWYYYTFLGALSLTILNSMKRVLYVNVQNFVLLFPILCMVQWGFWRGFEKAPSFIQCWFIGSAMTAIFGFTAGVLVFGESVTWLKGLGILLVLAGMGVLR